MDLAFRCEGHDHSRARPVAPLGQCFPNMNVHTHHLELIKVGFLGLAIDGDLLTQCAFITNIQVMLRLQAAHNCSMKRKAMGRNPGCLGLRTILHRNPTATWPHSGP